jgi:hypothetical protein
MIRSADVQPNPIATRRYIKGVDYYNKSFQLLSELASRSSIGRLPFWSLSICSRYLANPDQMNMVKHTLVINAYTFPSIRILTIGLLPINPNYFQCYKHN